MEKDSIMKEIHYMQQGYATLFSLVNKIQAKGDELFAPLTSRQYMALLAITHLEVEETTLMNIASKLGTTKQSANKLISSLEKKEFVTVSRNKKDKRAINVALTEEGKKILFFTSEKSLYFLGDLFHDLNMEEIMAFWSFLQRLYNFDGSGLDGFEDVGNINDTINIDGDKDSYQERVLKIFYEHRNRK